MKSFGVAMKHSYAVFVGLFVMIITFSMIGCALFKDVAPDYFSTPLDAIYTTFRIFTGEGWNEIPDTVASEVGNIWAHAVRLYFSLLLIIGCIIGMSLLNSVFVDAMVADNDDDIREKLNSIELTLDEIKKQLKNK
jgi:voltage-gated sodium channel